MISEETLLLAVDRAVLSPEQADTLRGIERQRAAAEFEPAPDREKLRFISGFGDIFVVIGIALFLGASGFFLRESGGPTALWIGLTLLSWALAELFTRRRRMALPSIVLLLTFAVSSFVMGNVLIAGLWSGGSRDEAGLFGIGIPSAGSIALSALATTALVIVHYGRFRVPITVAAAIAGFALALVAVLAVLAPDFVARFAGWIILGLGIGIFLLAMRFDQTDLRRETRRTDIAFWLHLLAAPMIVHSFIQIAFNGIGDISLNKAIGLIALFILLAILALLIDRRAILVSALVYAGIAFGTVFKETALVSATIPASLLVLGAFILALSSGWQGIRRLALRAVPRSLQARLPASSSAGNT